MGVVTKQIATLDTGEQGEVEAVRVAGVVGKLVSMRDVVTVTCDFAVCRNGKFDGTAKGPLTFVVDGDLPPEYWPGLRTYNAKDELKWFCGRRCLEQYLATDYVSCPVPHRDNLIEFPGKYGQTDVRRRA